MTPGPMATAPVEKKVNQTAVRLERGDLTAQAVDAFVFYAKENLELGSGYGTAIGSRGGDAIKKELATLGGLKMGEALITTAGRLPAKHIIHACGPKFQEPDIERKLGDCMLAALNVADRNGLKTVAFPPLGAGFYGIPLEVCSRVMLEAIKEYLQRPTGLEEVIICVNDRRDFNAFQDQVERL